MAIRKSTAAAQSVRLARRTVLMVSAGARGLFLRRRLATNSHSHSRRITGGLRRQGVTVLGARPVAFATIFPVVFRRCAPNHHLRLWRTPQCPCFAGSNYLFTQIPLIRLQLTLKSKSGLSDSLNPLQILPDSNLAENALRYIFSKNSNPGAP
jgi:hypothetical protein